YLSCFISHWGYINDFLGTMLFRQNRNELVSTSHHSPCDDRVHRVGISAAGGHRDYRSGEWCRCRRHTSLCTSLEHCIDSCPEIIGIILLEQCILLHLIQQHLVMSSQLLR